MDQRTSKMMKRDLANARKAGLEESPTAEERAFRESTDFLLYKNKNGHFADFHANRHTFITNLARAGVSPKVAQTLARHSDVRLTINVYTHTDLSEQADAVAKLPSLQAYKNVSVSRVEKPKVAGDVNPTQQRHSSTSAAQHDPQRQSKSAGGTKPVSSQAESRSRKPL